MVGTIIFEKAEANRSMNSHPTFQKNCLAALLLAGCCCAIAEPDTGNPVVQNPVEAQAIAPVTPAAAATADPVARVPVGANDPMTASTLPDQEMETVGVDPTAAEPVTGNDADAGSVDVPETPSAAVAGIDPETLYGEWTVKEEHPDAGEVVTLFSINADSSFAGTMTVAGNIVWSYSGNWYLDGNLITWFYTQSTPALMLADETEVDEIIAVDSQKLTYRSGKRDVVETLYRSR
jgi:hypothetical protein